MGTGRNLFDSVITYGAESVRIYKKAIANLVKLLSLFYLLKRYLQYIIKMRYYIVGAKLEIIYLKSDRKTLALEITKDLSVLVRMPYTCPKSRADQFVKDHLDWITVNLEKQRRRAEQFTLSDKTIKALRAKAKEIIPKRVEYFSHLTGLVPGGVGITSAKTRFGSCSGKNRLNFSLYLMQYSAEAIDYVVLHEICHIRYKNHGKDFYGLIARYMPDYKKYVKELKK